jgi:hypothetical protein
MTVSQPLTETLTPAALFILRSTQVRKIIIDKLENNGIVFFGYIFIL